MRAKTKTVVIVKDQIESVTKGLPKSYPNRLAKLSPKHISVICDYISALGSEINLSDNYKQSIFNTLITLSKCVPSKGFKDFTRSDIVTYLNQFKKEESVDPTHKWIGTYNAHLVNVIKFFRWLYAPDIEPKKRPNPKVVQNLHKLTRREISGYEPSDMWDAEDHLLFLKYCPNSRDKCYHAMEVDMAARPHELLGLRIKDVKWEDGEGGSRYATVVVNGKTSQRSLPLIDSIPYVTQWISLHPQGSNRDAILLPSVRTGKEIQVHAMYRTYKNYKKHFMSLLSSKDVPEEDKKRIRDLLNKKWNPYVLRHSAITEKSKILSSDSKLRQYAGWTARSNMHHKYVHFGGGEATNDLLRLRGVIKDEKQSNNILQPKICPNCKESNKPDSQFCFKCNFVMSFEAYQKNIEEKEKKDQELQALRNEIRETKALQQRKDQNIQVLVEAVKKLDSQMKFYRNQWIEYENEFGLTSKSRRRIAELKKQLDDLPDDGEDFEE